ncbi:MAG: hypothetical protein A2Y33_16740 [Spirochaetes bacterium GWF1_51_8]|nr:MAG: hypothetical protein A2Y33_16740 [Spirochaetes bacterium GWF1_51_8]
MRRFVLISFIFGGIALAGAAPSKAPVPAAKPILPKTAVVSTYEGFPSQDDFNGSQEAYSLSMAYQSLLYQLSLNSSNIELTGQKIAQFTQNTPGIENKLIAEWGLDYLIRLNLVKTGALSQLKIFAVDMDGKTIVSGGISIYGKLSPESFEILYSIIGKTMREIAGDFANKKLAAGKIETNKVVVTNYTTVEKTSHVYLMDIEETYGTNNKLTLKGEFLALELTHSGGKFTLTNDTVSPKRFYLLHLSPGLNILKVTFPERILGFNTLEYKNEQIFLIKNKSPYEKTIDLDDFAHPLVTHFFIAAGFEQFLSYSLPVLDIDFGFRLAVSSASKIKIAINSAETKYSWFHGAAFKFGVETAISPYYNGLDYSLLWFIDFITSGIKYGIETGIGIRLHPLLSFDAGIAFKLPLDRWYGDQTASFGFFLRYNIYMQFPLVKKNYELVE